MGIGLMFLYAGKLLNRPGPSAQNPIISAAGLHLNAFVIACLGAAFATTRLSQNKDSRLIYAAVKT